MSLLQLSLFFSCYYDISLFLLGPPNKCAKLWVQNPFGFTSSVFSFDLQFSAFNHFFIYCLEHFSYPTIIFWKSKENGFETPVANANRFFLHRGSFARFFFLHLAHYFQVSEIFFF